MSIFRCLPYRVKKEYRLDFIEIIIYYLMDNFPNLFHTK